MLKGCDVSKWNLTTPTACDFLIARASCGTVKDRLFLKHMENSKTDLVGAYHYAKTNQDFKENAKTFLSAIENVKYYGKSMLLALDIEADDLKRVGAVDWCIKWLDYVYNKTGIKPLLYISASNCNKFKRVASLDYGLWVAHWNVVKPRVSAWKTWALWQYSDSKGKLDLDYFNGTREQYLKYCTPRTI